MHKGTHALRKARQRTNPAMRVGGEEGGGVFRNDVLDDIPPLFPDVVRVEERRIVEHARVPIAALR
jgi:hypothetical protein